MKSYFIAICYIFFIMKLFRNNEWLLNHSHNYIQDFKHKKCHWTTILTFNISFTSLSSNLHFTTTNIFIISNIKTQHLFVSSLKKIYFWWYTQILTHNSYSTFQKILNYHMWVVFITILEIRLMIKLILNNFQII